MIGKTLFGLVRKTSDRGNEFALKDELYLLHEPAAAHARTVKRSADPYDKANPVVRVARFQLLEVPL